MNIIGNIRATLGKAAQQMTNVGRKVNIVNNLSKIPGTVLGLMNIATKSRTGLMMTVGAAALVGGFLLIRNRRKKNENAADGEKNNKKTSLFSRAVQATTLVGALTAAASAWKDLGSRGKA